MKPARILLLVVAVVAAGLAAFLATRGAGPAPAPTVVTEVVPEARTQVLIAAAPIGVGERLSEASVSWQDWPELAVRPEYITIATAPDAATQMVGTIARFEMFTGEPIRQEKLIRTDQGYLSAVLDEGKRAVSVPVTTESGAGGFIVPNDRVDIIVTRSGNEGDISEIVLSNLKVLAIGQRLGEVGASAKRESADDTAAQTFDTDTIATLEVDSSQAEGLVNAQSQGRLSLALRSIVDARSGPGVKTERETNTVRLIRYGRQSDIVSGVQADAVPAAGAAPAFDTSSYTPPAPQPVIQQIMAPSGLPVSSAPAAPESAQ